MQLVCLSLNRAPHEYLDLSPLCALHNDLGKHKNSGKHSRHTNLLLFVANVANSLLKLCFFK